MRKIATMLNAVFAMTLFVVSTLQVSDPADWMVKTIVEQIQSELKKPGDHPTNESLDDLPENVAGFSEFAKLNASDAQASDHFGQAVALSGTTLVVGAWNEDGGLGDPLPNAGAVYVYERDLGGPGNWGEAAKLAASDAQAGDYFGYSVAISGNTIVVGAWSEDGGSGDPLPGAGAAYVFERNLGGPGNWGEAARLSASDPGQADLFGNSVSISGDSIVVGASQAPTIPGNPNLRGGAVYVFERNLGGAGNWGEAARLSASDAEDFDGLGISVAIDGDTIVAGAWYANTASGHAGAAYIYERDLGGPENWGEAVKLTAYDHQPIDYFGQSVAINGDTVVVSAEWEDGGSGDPIQDAGAAYVFERDLGGWPDTWGFAAKLVAGDAQPADAFGSSVAVSGDRVVVGALAEDGGFGDPLFAVGATYVYERNIGGPNHWGEVWKLLSNDGEEGDLLGTSVAVSDELVVAGAAGKAGGQGDMYPGAGAVYLFKHLDDVLYLPIILR